MTVSCRRGAWGEWPRGSGPEAWLELRRQALGTRRPAFSTVTDGLCGLGSCVKARWLFSKEKEILESRLHSSRGLYRPTFSPSHARGWHPEPLTNCQGALAASHVPRARRPGPERGGLPSRRCRLCHRIPEMPLARMSAGGRRPSTRHCMQSSVSWHARKPPA